MPILALICALWRADPLSLREAMGVAITRAVARAANTLPRVRDAAVVDVDIGSFSAAAGAAAPNREWLSLANLAGNRARVGRAQDVLHCDGSRCRTLPDGEILVHADSIVMGRRSMCVLVSVSWGTLSPQGPPRAGSVLYEVSFTRAADGYILSSVRRTAPVMTFTTPRKQPGPATSGIVCAGTT